MIVVKDAFLDGSQSEKSLSTNQIAELGHLHIARESLIATSGLAPSNGDLCWLTGVPGNGSNPKP